MIRELVDSRDPILQQRVEEFDFTNPSVDPIEFAKDLAESMLHHNGIGLSANQIGVPVRAFAIRANPIIVMYNPKIVYKSTRAVYLEEGCLSYPGYWIKIKRPKEIRVRWIEPNGNMKTERFNGITARCILHEYDHLEGDVFYKKATTYHREQARKRMKRLRENLA